MGCRVRWLACVVLIVFGSHIVQGQQKQKQQAQPACKDARPDAPKDLRLKAMPSTSSIGAVWNPPGNGACVDYYLGKSAIVTSEPDQCSSAVSSKFSEAGHSTFSMNQWWYSGVHTQQEMSFINVAAALADGHSHGVSCNRS